MLADGGADEGGDFRSDFFQMMRFAGVRGGSGDDFIAGGTAGDESAVGKDFAAAENLSHEFPLGRANAANPILWGASGLPIRCAADSRKSRYFECNVKNSVKVPGNPRKVCRKAAVGGKSFLFRHIHKPAGEEPI